MRRFAQRLERGLEWFLILQMIALTAVVIYAVIVRKAGISASWYDEVASIQLAWLTYYGAALAALKRKHIGFDGVLLLLGPSARAAAIVTSEALTIGFFALMTWSGMEVLAVLEGMGLTSLPWVPVQFTQSVIPMGGALFILCTLLSLPEYWRETMAGHSFEHPEVVVEPEEGRA